MTTMNYVLKRWFVWSEMVGLEMVSGFDLTRFDNIYYREHIDDRKFSIELNTH